MTLQAGTALLANPQFAVATPSGDEPGLARQRQTTGINLATAVQERFYSGGPTDLLRVVKDMDNRVVGLDTDPSAHECLTAAPVPVTVAVPSGQSFTVKLQCQVLMHLLTDKGADTLELAMAGTGVGFCSGNLKVNADHLFVSGKTNGVPPPGAAMNGQYCDAVRAGCFAIGALATDLGESSAACAGVASSSFAMHTGLDASTDGSANVTPANIHQYFGTKPTGVPAF